MQGVRLSWEWVSDDGRDDVGILIEPEKRQLTYWGAARNWQGPEFAHPSGGHSITFDEFLARPEWAPAAIRAEVLASVRALLADFPSIE